MTGAIIIGAVVVVLVVARLWLRDPTIADQSDHSGPDIWGS